MASCASKPATALPLASSSSSVLPVIFHPATVRTSARNLLLQLHARLAEHLRAAHLVELDGVAVHGIVTEHAIAAGVAGDDQIVLLQRRGERRVRPAGFSTTSSPSRVRRQCVSTSICEAASCTGPGLATQPVVVSAPTQRMAHSSNAEVLGAGAFIARTYTRGVTRAVRTSALCGIRPPAPRAGTARRKSPHRETLSRTPSGRTSSCAGRGAFRQAGHHMLGVATT